MDVNFYYFTLMLIPMLAGRSMMTIFSSAAVATLGKYEYFDGIDMVEVLPLATLTNLPDWVTDPKFLIATFILAILEKKVSQSPSFQDFWNMNEAKIKGLLAAIVAFFMVNETVDQIIKSATAAPSESSDIVEHAILSLENAWVGLIGFLTWLLAAIRSSVMMFLIEVDQDDSMGFRKMIGRLESGLGMFGPLVFIIMPMAALACAGFAVATVAYIKYRVNKLEKKHQQLCPNCEHANHMSALHCGNCNIQLQNVKDVGFMGLSKLDVPAGNLEQHKQKLLESGRCSYCASKGNNNGMESVCKTCNRPLFESKQAAQTYLNNLRKKIPLTLLVTSACGFFPIVGLIPGIIFYRLYLISGLKVYVSHKSSFFIRIGLRIFFVFLIFWNMAPFFGFVSVPIMAMSNYFLYSNSIKGQMRTLNR